RPDLVVPGCEIVTGTEQVTGIEAEADAVPNVRRDPLPKLGQLLEGAAQCGAGAGGPLDQEHHRGHHAETLGIAARIAFQSRFTVVDVVARVRHNRADSE